MIINSTIYTYFSSKFLLCRALLCEFASDATFPNLVVLPKLYMASNPKNVIILSFVDANLARKFYHLQQQLVWLPMRFLQIKNKLNKHTNNDFIIQFVYHNMLSHIPHVLQIFLLEYLLQTVDGI